MSSLDTIVSTAREPHPPIEIFLAYAHKDQRYLEQLELVLETLRRQETEWPISLHTAEIVIDQSYKQRNYLLTAQIILLLVSPDFISSDFCYSADLMQAIKRHENQTAIVIPIILRATSWEKTPFSRVPSLPANGKPVTRWSNRDAAFQHIGEGIRDALQAILEGNVPPMYEENKPVTSFSQTEEKRPKSRSRATKETPEAILNLISQTSETKQQTPTSPTRTQSNLANTTIDEDANKIAQAIVKEGQLESDAVQKKATSDIPIQSLDEDKLGFDVYARALRDFIGSPETSTPLTIGIFGAWGSGKSSLMHIVQNELDPPLHFWSRLWIKKLWIKWFFSFCIALLPWMFGKLLIWIDDKIGSMRQFQQIHIGPLNDGNNEYRAGGPKKFRDVRTDLRYEPPLNNGRGSKWLENVRANLSYDPTDLESQPSTNPQDTSGSSSLSNTTQSTDASNMHKVGKRKGLSFWQRVAAAHFPLLPPTHPTIWFNAWKFDQEEQLWAALALEVLEQIKQKYNFFQRIAFWFRLMLKRFSLSALWSVIKTLAFPLFFGLIYWIYNSYAKQLPKLPPLQAFGLQIPLGQLLLGAGIVVSALIQILKIAKDPFQLKMKNVFDKPNYKDKIGFIGSFEEDFARIVSLVTRPRLGWQPRKLVIFIDDLDRCEPPKAADIIEGINLFLDSQSCIFVLGMDPVAVAASIENKYKDLFEKMRSENMAVVSPGRLFLDKIIQVPFYVPQSTENGIAQLLTDIMQSKAPIFRRSVQSLNLNAASNGGGSLGPAVNPVSTTLPPLVRTPQIDRASYKLEHIRTAISEGAKFLPENPRQVKKYMNLFRFYVYIADARELLRFREEGPEKRQIGLTLNRLAVWVAWSIRWPEIAKPLAEEVQTAEMRDHLFRISNLLQNDGCWCSMEHAAGLDSEFRNLTLFPIENYELKKHRNLVYEKLVKRIDLTREAEKHAPSHWSHLPWEWWLLDPDFLKGIKEMESFWKLPQENEDDWLMTVLTWTRVTFSTRTNIPTVGPETTGT